MAGELRLVVLLSAALAGACATAPRGEVEALRARVEELRQQRVEEGRRAQEMSNRLLILEDRFDTSRVEREREPRELRLPVITLDPGPAPADPAPAYPAPVPAYLAGAEGAPAAAEVEGFGADDPAGGGGDDGGGAYDEGWDGGTDAAPRPVLHAHGAAGRAPRLPQRPAAAAPAPPPAGDRLPAAPLPPAGVAADRDGEVLRLYREGQDLLAAGDTVAAEARFREVVRRHPAHDYADNAAYWAAECRYHRRDFAGALVAFREVVDRYPHGNKAPHALLKLAYSYAAMGQEADARQVLAEVARTYPRADVARLAEVRLKEVSP